VCTDVSTTHATFSVLVIPTYLPSIESSMKFCRGEYRIDTIYRPKKGGKKYTYSIVWVSIVPAILIL